MTKAPAEVYEVGKINRGGRPTKYTVELGERLCEQLAEGELAIEVCKATEMPCFSTIMYWRRAHPEFAELYHQARMMQAQALAERAVMSGRRATAEDASAARVRFDADRWLAGRIDPLNYGQRMQQQQLDKDGNPTDPVVPVLRLTIGRE